ncbi:hypothetical protein CY35_16G089000 [Sphagnum magellanicum]|nr:hypothetical protein CY35_16G089000 [Sphagnum magellanicum]
MVKLHTTLINNTGKKLSIYEESSNGAQTLVTMLHPKHVPTTTHTTTDSRTTPTPTDPITTPTTNSASENSRSTQELPNYYKYVTDPNDSYATIRIWCEEKAVLGVSTDEMIDNETITIEFKDGEFIKQYEARGARKNPASSALLGDFRNIFRNIFRSHKSANSNAGK